MKKMCKLQIKNLQQLNAEIWFVKALQKIHPNKKSALIQQWLQTLV